MEVGFKTAFGHFPRFVVHAPGRVNIIGEHIDYNGYGVLPIAVSKTVKVAVGIAPNDSNPALDIRHHSHQRFSNKAFPTRENIRIDLLQQLHWTNYVIAAYIGIEEAYKQPLPRLQLFVDGDIPQAAGLSSSSALVVAVACALARLVGLHMTRSAMADLCAATERHVGTCGGGMDQAAILLCTQGYAKKIDFDPLTATDLKLPSEAAFIVANSLLEAPKAVHAATHFNKRVFECRLAAFLLHRATCPNNPPISPAELPTYPLKRLQVKLGVTPEECVNLVEKHIAKRLYSKVEIERILTPEHISAIAESRIGPTVWEKNFSFDPYKRAIHVYSEAARVDAFCSVCRDTSLSSGEQMKRLGDILNASDSSLHTLYECGASELSELSELSRKSGSLGSRVTGAGWGGCTVSLVWRRDQDTVLEQIEDYYHAPRDPPLWISDDLQQYMFAVEPTDGATIFACSETDGTQDEVHW